jgi:hypothetical protein
MKTSKEIVLKSGLLPRLQLGIRMPRGGVKPTGPHTVKILEDSIIKKPGREDEASTEVHYVRYIVEENGIRKQYDTRLKTKGGSDPSYFVQAMAEIEPGEEVILEMMKSGPKNYINITRPSLGQASQAEEEAMDMGDEQEEDIT